MGMRQPTGAAFAVTDSNGDRFFVDVVKSGRINRPVKNFIAGTMAARWMISMIGHRGVFRGGWSVLVFASDRRTLVHKVRCQSRERAAELGQDVQARGLTALAAV